MPDDLNQIDLFGDTKPKRSKKKRTPPPKPLSKVARRAIKTSVDIQMEPPDVISYQHTVLCQTSLPYRNPGKDVLRWEHKQGSVHLLVNAGEALNPDTDEYVKLGLPFGPKPRLILAYLNAQAIKTSSPVIDMEDSLTAFVKRIQNPMQSAKTGPNGYEIRAFKDHLGRLSVATIRMAVSRKDQVIQINNQIVDAFDLWFPKNEKQRVLWPSTVHLNDKYFASLQNHAVPLDERALSALAHSAMALDIYCWLAQRLHRIPEHRPQFITWTAVKGQFGPDFDRMDNFKRKFRIAMKQVLSQYSTAHVEEDGGGLTLRNSTPPVPKRLFLVNNPVS